MKILGTAALVTALAASVPVFAQTPNPATNAVVGGTNGAGVGALIGCIVTIPIGCAPGAAVGAAVGGGVGATAAVANTPPPYYYPPRRRVYRQAKAKWVSPTPRSQRQEAAGQP